MALQSYLTSLTCLMYIVSAYREAYRGFDSCGHNGWHCNKLENGGLEIVFQCDSINEGARLWLWTARIPNSAVSYVIQNCENVELHIDCTTGLRAYTLSRFQVKNVGNLEILKPLRAQVFLHDNEQIYHAPPEFILTNINRVTMYPGVFDKAGGRCRTRQQFLQKLEFSNITIPYFNSALATQLSLESLMINNSTIVGFEKNSFNLSATTIIDIRDNQIKKIKEGALTLNAEKVIMNGNQIDKIEKDGITVASKSFSFNANEVEGIDMDGLAVIAHEVTINKNTFGSLKQFALAGIKPGQNWYDGIKPFTKFSYEFSHNIVKTYEENSLLPFYQRYSESCSKIIIENNQILCNCQFPYQAKNQNKTKWENTYPELFSKSNQCLKTNISLSSFLNNCQELVCNGSHTAENCTIDLQEFTKKEYRSTEPASTATFFYATYAPAVKIPVSSDSTESKPVSSYYKSTTSTILWTVFGIVILLIISGGVVYWAKEKRKVNTIRAISSYKHEKNISGAYDHEILIEGIGDNDQ